MSDILSEIIETKRGEVATAKAARPVEELRERAEGMPECRGFASALKTARPMGVIAEVKKASPSAGVIRADFDPVEIARTYAEYGAACISVLTDEHYFQGHLDYLSAIRNAVALPLLRKDFLIDEYQVWEARAAGADAVLLIAECLDDDELRALYMATLELGMDALIECYEPENVPRVLSLDPTPKLLGINNRNLRTFKTDLQHSLGFVGQMPEETLLISESGISGPEAMRTLYEGGVRAILVGETLMRADDPGAALRELLAVCD